VVQGARASGCSAAGFREVDTFTEARRFPFASFDAYFAPIPPLTRRSIRAIASAPFYRSGFVQVVKGLF
jgi:hypothetical protein